MSKLLIPNSTQIPNVILDHWMAVLSGAEFKVVLYIARRTYGFGKESDTISLNQLARGIKKRSGEQLDYGTGLSRSSVKSACTSLVERGILIKSQSTVGDSHEPDQNTYRLNLYAPIKTEGEEEPTPPSASGESKVQDLGSNHEVGQKSAQIGQKLTHLETPLDTPEEVGQKLTHVGQNSTHPGQLSAYGGPKIGPEVGQKLAPQNKDQNQEIQTTTTGPTSGELLKLAVVAFSPSALEGKGREGTAALLRAQGFSAKDASQLSERFTEAEVRDQVEWLPRRTISKNKLGLLRRAIEERWPKPENAEESKKAVEKETREAKERAVLARRREIADGLRQLYSRLPIDAPEAFSTFTSYIEEEKAKVASRPLVRENPKRLEIMLGAFETEERKLSLPVEFFQEREVPLKEFAPLVRVPLSEVSEALRVASPA